MIPELGRWTKRDPIEEEGGGNLYAILNNAPCEKVDYFGLYIASDLKMARAELRERKRKFMCWYYQEKKNMSWVDRLTKCPRMLTPVYVNVPISESLEYQIEYINSQRRPAFWPSTFKKISKYENPDPQEWSMDSRDSVFNAFYWVGPQYHPGGFYELRTRNPYKYNGSGNQCVYGQQGRLCTDIPTAGTADRISPNADFWGHQHEDVEPYDLAKSLGRKYIEKYYEVRPIW